MVSRSPRTPERQDSAQSHGIDSWLVLLVRAVVAGIPGLMITFIPNHSSGFGLLLFAAWAIISGIVLGALRLSLLRTTRQRALARQRVGMIVGSVVSLLTAVAGVAVLVQSMTLATLLVTVMLWAALTGTLELIAGIYCGDRDAITVGAFTVALAVGYFLLPMDDVFAVGLWGAYLMVLAVYLTIAALTVRWHRAPAQRLSPVRTS